MVKNKQVISSHIMHLKNEEILQGGKYKIVRFIASGGFGCTYEAHHTLLDLRVALKEFFVSDFCNRDENTGQVTVGTHSKVGLYDKLKKKFLDEARALYKMKHPGIVRVIDVFEENCTAYYTMEYIDGHSLSDVVKKAGKLQEAEAVGYILQVADALKYVHGLNRLHLDIKPGNIMLNKDGKVVLIDFGASKHYDDETGENTSTLLGINTKGYAPVEQVNQSFKSFCPATDIYALGATLYKLLTGITPPSSTLLQSEEATLIPLPSSISSPTRKAVEAAMQLLRKKRPQSVEELEVILIDNTEMTHIDSGENGREENLRDGSTTNNPKALRHLPWKWISLVCAVITIASIAFFAFHHTIPDDSSNETDTYSSQEETVQVEADRINGHEYVDLGLSVKWATCNIGANKPEDYGYYFAWGETKRKSYCSKNTSKTYGKDMEDIAGDLQHDAARTNWGGDRRYLFIERSWRMPTKDECMELINKCSWKMTTQGGHSGYLITSKINGKSIFLPKAGLQIENIRTSYGISGYYWSSTPSDNETAYMMCFSDTPYVGKYYRDSGFTIRPVSE